MKVRVILISSAALIGCAIILFFALAGGSGSNASGFEQAEWEALDTEQIDKRLTLVFASGRLPSDQEKAFLIWAYTNHPEKSEAVTREHAYSIANLPWYLSDGAWDLVRAKEYEAGMRMLGLAGELFPNNPDVLGMTGIIAYLRGDKASALRFLEEAESWRRNRPIVDFYLGGMLVVSESTADRTRGKSILMGLVNGSDAELRELSGLTLLTNTNVPMIPEDLDAVYEILEANSVFVVGNPRLPAEALRVIINLLAPQFPERAMVIADLLVQHPQAGANDFIGMIRLSQSLGETSKARLHLDSLLADPALLATIENASTVDRITAIQAYLEESYEDGLTGMQEFVHNPDADTAMVQEAFRAILQIDLPLEVESELLELYLELPVQDVTMSLGVLNRLVQLQPLQEEEWIHYAIAQLLEWDVLSVGSWLSEIEASESVISELKEIDPAKLSDDQALVLVNAYIVEKDSENAQATLNQSKSVLDPVSSAFLQSQIFAQQNRIDEAIEFWKEAYQGVVGTNRFPLMKNLGLLALQLDQPVNAMQSLYTAFSAGIPFNEIQAGKLIGLTMEYGSLRQAIQVAEYLAGRFSDSPVHQNNLAYFRFLAEEQVEESVEVMRGLVEEYSDIPQFRLTLALGLVKSGRSNEANRLLKSTDINWQETSTRGLLIYCVVLAASDQQTLAQGLLQSLDTEVLIPEEKALLESF